VLALLIARPDIVGVPHGSPEHLAPQDG
jgi:hypothetical protein